MIGPSTLWLLPALAAFFSFYEGDSLDQPVAEAPAVLQEYDYIVVGGGSSGSVVAARLSEDPEVTVLLLEAGGQETEFSEVPGLAVYLQLSQMDWQYKAEPSTTSCLAMVSNRCNLPRGKVIGGSSSINYMLYVRGNRQDYDLWEAQGNRGWGYDHVLPFFKYSEDNSNPTLATNSAFQFAFSLHCLSCTSCITVASCISSRALHLRSREDQVSDRSTDRAAAAAAAALLFPQTSTARAAP